MTIHFVKHTTTRDGTLALTMQSYFEQALAQLVKFEGCVPWMYLDTVGKVTVGVGLMLPDAAAAQALPFQFNGQPSTPDQIAAEFHRVATLPKAKLPNFYRGPTALELPLPTITDKLRIVLTGFEQKLRESVKGYDAFPDGVKQALLDMAYNLGPAGLLKEYPHFLSAIEAGNWTQAAAGCTRRGPSPARNEWTKASILSAVPVHTIQARAESWAYRLGRLLWWLPKWLLQP
jgi:GH24 family phage-related lysozyme (muramidase)